MKLLTGTVSLIQLDNIYLALSVEDTLLIGQSSEIKLLKKSDAKTAANIGSFDYAGTDLPAYCLNDQLLPSQDRSLVEQSQFCIGLRTAQEEDYSFLLCKSFEQIDLSEQAHDMQEIPAFMCKEKMLAQGILEYKNLIYLVTSADKILDYIVTTDSNNDSDQKLEKKNGRK